MIENIKIENYKSVQSLEMDLGRFNIIIGENGSGKTNILEAIAMASAASQDKLDNEFLASRGIRVTEPKFMRSAFDVKNVEEPILITIIKDKNGDVYLLNNKNKEFSNWVDLISVFKKNLFKRNILLDNVTEFEESILKRDKTRFELINKVKEFQDKTRVSKEGITNSFIFQDNLKNFLKTFGNQFNFLIYCPENSALRNFHQEGQIQPLGIKGEGLLDY